MILLQISLIFQISILQKIKEWTNHNTSYGNGRKIFPVDGKTREWYTVRDIIYGTYITK